MSTERTLERIDSTLEQWDEWDGHSPDATRWADGEWIDARKPGPTAWMDEFQEFQQRALAAVALGRFPQRVMFGTPEPPTARARLDAMEEMAQACGLTMTEWQRVVLNQWLAPSVPLTYFPPQRPHSAAERTRSPQWRAGTRRTKRHARRRT